MDEQEEEMTEEEFNMLKRFILGDIEKILNAESLEEAKEIAAELHSNISGKQC